MIEFVTGEPAILIKDDEKILVSGDQHLGFEYELAKAEVNIPFQTTKMLRRLITIIERKRPDKLIFLGDVKHNIPEIAPHEWQDVFDFFEGLLKRVNEVMIIPGNHDGGLKYLIPPEIKILPTKGVIVGEEEKVALLHGHTWPDAKLFEAEYMIIGHNHPVIHMRDHVGRKIVRQIWLECKINKKQLAKAFLNHHRIKFDEPLKVMSEIFGVEVKSSKLIIMPSFNEVLGGLPVNVESLEGFLGPILQSGSVNIDDAEVYLLDGTFMAHVKHLRRGEPFILR